MSERIVAIVPARMASSRFPGKPLVPLLGIPMVEHVRRRAALREAGVDDVIVATCDVSIRDADKPLGTFVFTAVAQSEDGAELRWNALAMYPDPIDPDATRQGGGRSPEPGRTDTEAAAVALERISIPQDIDDNIAVLSQDLTLTNDDRRLLAEFSGKAYEAKPFSEMKTV